LTPLWRAFGASPDLPKQIFAVRIELAAARVHLLAGFAFAGLTRALPGLTRIRLSYDFCDPVAKWTIGRVALEASPTSAKALLDKLIAEAPFEIHGIQVGGGSEFKSCSRRNVGRAASSSSSCRPSAQTSMAASNAHMRCTRAQP
jgi:hypothetical protein